MVHTKLSVVYPDLDSTLDIKPTENLQSISVRQAVGTHFEKDSPGYEMMKSIPMTPLLFPQYLLPGDILYIHEPPGSTIVKVVRFEDEQHATEIEMRNSRPGRPDHPTIDDQLHRRRYKQFQPVVQTIVYDLGTDHDTEDTYFTEDLSNAFIIHKQVPPTPPH
jgi:hypothetical protein